MPLSQKVQDIKVRIHSIHSIFSQDPERKGKRDRVVIIKAGRMGRSMVIIPEEQCSDLIVEEAIKEEVLTMAQMRGLELSFTVKRKQVKQ